MIEIVRDHDIPYLVTVHLAVLLSSLPRSTNTQAEKQYPRQELLCSRGKKVNDNQACSGIKTWSTDKLSMWVGKGSGAKRILREKLIPSTCGFVIGRVGVRPLSGDGCSPNVVNQVVFSNDMIGHDSDGEE